MSKEEVTLESVAAKVGDVSTSLGKLARMVQRDFRETATRTQVEGLEKRLSAMEDIFRRSKPI